ncbi:MAG: MetQ/NlpA family ABC transporter substrate-binding protein [Sphaerochaeta sp.]|jgi:D-methionine transport system substrate-binding protein|nr:MetQ/NlpA family ABC transporter substrate-binding protein [Sphaerochaeta sp.]
MRSTKKVLVTLLITAVLASAALFANGAKETSSPTTTKQIRIGVSPGPYGDMVKQAIAPYLEKQGYTVSVVQFSDWVQPDQALNNGEIEANLMQHTVYLNAFSKANNLDLAAVIIVPTAGAGVFSHVYTSLDQLKTGDQVAIASDVTNLARSLGILARFGVITLKDGIDPTKVSLSDIASNPKNLKFQTLDGAQISRSLDSVAIGIVPGNYAIAAGLDYTKALAIEKLAEGYKNVVAVRTPDVDSQLGRDLKAAVESEDFYNAITKPGSIFNSFDRPQWWVDKYGEGK